MSRSSQDSPPSVFPLSDPPLLEIRGLHLRKEGGPLLRDLWLKVLACEGGSLVGPSGAGKSLLADLILGFIPSGFQVEGTLLWRGEKLPLPQGPLPLRGRQISYLPQTPEECFDPCQTVEKHLREFTAALGVAFDRQKTLQALRLLDLPDRTLSRYPFELSSGMLQRVALVRTLSTPAQLLVLDEPTSSQDEGRSSLMLKLLLREQKIRRFSFLMITHKWREASSLSGPHRVMRKGELLEENRALFQGAFHPWSREWLKGGSGEGEPSREGCFWRERCLQKERCLEAPLRKELPGGWVRCAYPCSQEPPAS